MKIDCTAYFREPSTEPGLATDMPGKVETNSQGLKSGKYQVTDAAFPRFVGSDPNDRNKGILTLGRVS